MKGIFHKSKNYADAERYDILQHITMTPEQRQKIAYLLRIRVFGKKNPDVRESKFCQKRHIANPDEGD